MLPNPVKRKIDDVFENALNEKRRRIYFDKYHSGRDLNDLSLVDEFKDELNEDSLESVLIDIDDTKILKINNEPVLFYTGQKEKWIVIFSSRIEEPVRGKVRDLASIKGWLIEAWIPGNTLDDIYREYSPVDENISLKRSWDPYYLYKRKSKIPEEYRQYFSEHPREFSQQNVEVDITTPKWRLDETIDNAMTDFLENKSETERSEFTMEAESTTGFSSDGGAVSKGQSSVRVKESGKVTHQSGDIGATLTLVDETEERTRDLYERFEDVTATYQYEEFEDGTITLANYNRGQNLLFKIPEFFTKDISIKLSNFLTVGQKDVDLYGIVSSRNKKEFTTITEIPYNRDEYKISVTGIRDDEETAVYIRPSQGSTTGLVYLYHKLQQKFDPNIEVEKIESIPTIPRGG